MSANCVICDAPTPRPAMEMRGFSDDDELLFDYSVCEDQICLDLFTFLYIEDELIWGTE